jgi:cytochrome c biogenesis protein CcdA
MNFFFFIAVLAGVLTVLAPCIFPLLPIVIGASEPGERRISRRAWIVIGSLSLSVILFTLILKGTTLLIEIPQAFWNIFSGVIIVLVGIAMLFPTHWARLPFVHKLSSLSNKTLSKGFQRKSHAGDMLVGFALGPVFTTCSPTYLFIIATILPAGFLTGVFYLIGFTLGLALSLLLIAYFGQILVSKISDRMDAAGWIKKAFAVLIILVGLAIMTGLDKKIEARILDSGYGATISFEERLINRFAPKQASPVNNSPIDKNTVDIPKHVRNAFPDTDWSKADARIEKILSGGPGKDGIPSIDEPQFEPLADFRHPDSVQAIVLDDAGKKKVYPYNILIWHEIVNDRVDGVPVAVTFCPLCGSAIVFDRRIDGQESDFGVSGFLLESNMVMFDRSSESLWQQSTGEAFAGKHFGRQLSLVPFQLMTIGELRQKSPDALVLSEDTGHKRDYARNPYSGYDESDDFIFRPSRESDSYHPKAIFVVFRFNERIVAVPWLSLTEGAVHETVILDKQISVSKKDGELKILSGQENIPFYFEMWFSFIAQHGDEGIVYDPDK